MLTEAQMTMMMSEPTSLSLMDKTNNVPVTATRLSRSRSIQVWRPVKSTSVMMTTSRGMSPHTVSTATRKRMTAARVLLSLTRSTVPITAVNQVSVSIVGILHRCTLAEDYFSQLRSGLRRREPLWKGNLLGQGRSRRVSRRLG